MAGAPTIHVYLDDGTGTYPIDMTSMVRLPDGINLSGYGRSDEQPFAQAATLNLTLDNFDGSFSSGVGFGMGGFGSGFFGGTVPIAPGTGIRYSLTSGATTVNRFTGRITSLELAWPTGGQEFSTVILNAVDPLAELSRKTLRSMLEQEILSDSPTAYYTLGETEGSTAAGDTSGNQSSPIVPSGTGSAVVFGNGTGPADGLTAAQFANGQVLLGSQPAGSYLGTGSWSVEFFLNVTTAPASNARVLQVDSGNNAGDRFRLDVFTDGHFLSDMVSAGVSGGSVVTSATTIGTTHHVVATYNGSFVTAYVDGASVGSSAATGAFPAGLPRLIVGGGDPTTGSPAVTGTMSHVAVYNTALSGARIAQHAGALSGFPDTTTTRLSRLASYVGRTAATSSGSGQSVATQATSGQALLDALQGVAAAEGGVFYADGSGALKMQGRSYRSLKASATLALPAEEPDPGTTIPWDTQQVINQVTVTRTAGAQQVYQDDASVASVGPFPDSVDTIVAGDADALAAAQWRVNKHKTSSPRIPTLTVNALAPVTSAASLLSLAIGDRVSLVLPSQQWTGSGDYTIEGWSETVTDTTWQISYNVLPWLLFSAFILDDATYGVLDSAANPIGF